MKAGNFVHRLVASGIDVSQIRTTLAYVPSAGQDRFHRSLYFSGVRFGSMLLYLNHPFCNSFSMRSLKCFACIVALFWCVGTP